ncbi:type I polyketide synthase [Pseudonocardia spinosispora]|uniref:type I polyketide synthase n=1 Tax=Pseudonocardia spinosispora TaxID=103441 RepID=UPI00041E448D|nr:type I polyketide synthase [Pseudonocardia spinosispora]
MTYRLAEPVAVVGMACRLPGSVTSPDELWRLLVSKTDPVTEGPFDRWDVDAFYDRDRAVPNGVLTRWAATLDDVTGFDAAFFGLSPGEAASLDPQHRLLLEASWEALENAGIPPREVAGSAGGVFVGIWNTDNALRLAGHWEHLDAYAATIGNTHSTAAGRVSYTLGLHGPAIALDTACSSSLVATHLAVQSLQAGEVDFAIAGGVNVMLSPEFMLSASRFGMFSPTGRCRAFDESGDGLVRGEGVGLVVLKRLADATRDGDRVLAVIRAAATNQDGRSQGLVAPSETAQRAVYQEAVARAGIDPGLVGLVETHGPGTPVGDPIEFRALTPVYGTGSGRCALGSVKSNIGHLESASGIAGFIKTVLALRHGVVPPNLHFRRWNRDISPDGTRFFVPTEPTPWPVEGPSRFAAVSSFGFSGTNAHVVLESAPDTPSEPSTGDDRPVMIPISATSPRMLGPTAARLADWLTDRQPDLADVAHTLSSRRSPHPTRATLIARTTADLITNLTALAAAHPAPNPASAPTSDGTNVALGTFNVPKATFVSSRGDGAGGSAVAWGTARPAAAGGAVWVFPGQGGQWAGMGRRMLAEEPAFADTIAELEPLIQDAAGFSVTEVITADELSPKIERIQVALFACQVALARVWRSHGLAPVAVIGHSMGEVAAAVTSGALSLADGVTAIWRRSWTLTLAAGTGAMVSVDLPRDDAEKELLPGVTVAVVSSPSSTVVGGDPEPTLQLLARWQERGLMARQIATDVASHGPHLDPHLGGVEEALRVLRPQRPTVRFYSTVHDDPRQEPACDGAYWRDNLRRPVQFVDAVRAAAEDGHAAFLEVSVHPVVTHSIRETLRDIDPDALVTHTLTRGCEEPTPIATQLGVLYRAGVPIEHTAPGTLLDLPTTVWDRQRHWIDVPLAHPGRRDPSGEVEHPLLGTHTEVPAGQGTTHLWLAELGTAEHPWLADHRVDDVTVLPGAAYAEIALAAAARHFECGPERIAVSALRFEQLLALDARTTASIELTGRGADEARLTVRTREETGWVTHATATLHRLSEPTVPAPMDVEPSDGSTAEDCYAALHGEGYQYGPAFTVLTAIHRPNADTCLAEVTLPAPARALVRPIALHPVLLDAALQAVLLCVRDLHTDGSLMFPVGIEDLRVFAETGAARYCRAELLVGDGGLTGTVALLDDAGAVLAQANGVRFAPRPRRHLPHERLLHTVTWSPAPLTAEPAPRGTWLVVGEGPLAASVHRRLVDSGVSVSVQNGPHGNIGARTADTFSDVLLIPGTTRHRHTEHVLAAARLAVRLAEADSNAASADAVGGSTPNHPRLWIAVDGHSLEHAGIRGLARTVMCEYPALRTTLVDVDTAADLVRECFADTEQDEVRWRDGARDLPRIVAAPPDPGDWRTRPTRTLSWADDGLVARIARPGQLDTFGLVPRPRTEPAEGEVEIRVSAVGLNFADVMTQLGVVSVGTCGDLGLECAGTVTRIGPGESGLAVGDRVMAFHDGVAGTFALVPSSLVVRVPDVLSDTEAAAIPGAYLTAWYSLVTVARLTEGERILIHAGTGGVGLAAITIARLLGAEVLATAGSERKRAYLRELGVEHVMDSRTLDFVEQTRALTGGVDVLLNSVSGDGLTAGLDVLAIGGRFVELGKRDIVGNSALPLAAFRRNITFASVDIALLARERPALIGELLGELATQLDRGALAALPCTEYPLTEAGTALRTMAAARHIGKLVLTVPAEGQVEVVAPVGSTPVVRPGGAYVITGGLGGLGLRMARWLADQKVARVVLSGRSVGSDEAGRTIAELREQGTEVEVVLGDIASDGVAELLVAAATDGGAPLRGVLHAAAVLDDTALRNLDGERLDRVWRPKVEGAWRLHEVTRGHDLDWMVLFSSIASLLGGPGQANYAAANDWLDTFARWRSARGARTLAVNWGAWGEHGRATELGERGYATFRTADGLAALETLLDQERVNAGVFTYDPGHWFASTPAAAASPLFADLPVAAEPDDARHSGIRADLVAARPDARRRLLGTYLTDVVRELLGGSSQRIDHTTHLPDLGFDSLTVLQLRNRAQQDLDTVVPANVIWTHPSIPRITDLLLHRMELHGGREEIAPSNGQPADRWFRVFVPRPNARARLYCFPHAGGSASTYRRWAALAPEYVEVHSLQLPGREDRAGEQPRTELASLARDIADAIRADHDDRPFALFGHSGGSLLAFEVARLLDATTRGLTVVGVSAAPAPASAGMAALYERMFLRDSPTTLQALALIPDEIRAEPILLAQAHHTLDSDYTLYRGFTWNEANAPLNCPILVSGGDSDEVVHPGDLDAWSQHTNAGAKTEIYPGDHFYLRNHIDSLLDRLTTPL